MKYFLWGEGLSDAIERSERQLRLDHRNWKILKIKIEINCVGKNWSKLKIATNFS